MTRRICVTIKNVLSWRSVADQYQYIDPSHQGVEVFKNCFNVATVTGKSNKEIEEEMLRSREKALQGHAKSEQLLIDLEKRYRQDKDAITAKLKGAGTNTMTAEQKLTEYGLILREQLRAREEGKFESAGLAVGIAERVKEQVQRYMIFILYFVLSCMCTLRGTENGTDRKTNDWGQKMKGMEERRDL